MLALAGEAVPLPEGIQVLKSKPPSLTWLPRAVFPGNCRLRNEIAFSYTPMELVLLVDHSWGFFEGFPPGAVSPPGSHFDVRRKQDSFSVQIEPLLQSD